MDTKYEVTYKELLEFFLPIAAMTMIMMSSHNVISSALAQTAFPAIALSAYSVGQSMSATLQAPIWAIVKLTTSVAQDYTSTINLMKVAATIGVIVLIGLILVAFTPLSNIVFRGIMGVSDELFDDTLKTFRILIIMPIFGVFRTTHQGFVALRRKTYWMTVGTIARISSMFITAIVLTKTDFITGGAIGATILLIGFSFESIVAFFTGRKWFKEAPEKNEDDRDPFTVKKIWLFFIPLILAQVSTSFVNPGISATLARATEPEEAISSYYIARSLAWIFLGMGFRVHQIVLVFVKDRLSWEKVRRFVYGLVLIMVFFLATIAFTPVGPWIYANILHVELDLAQRAIKALAFFVIIPPAMFISELHQGLMLKNQKSNGLTICKAFNIATLLGLIIILVNLMPHLGSTIAAISLAASYIVECGVALWLTKDMVFKERRNTKKKLKART
jgi:Na+-driven multidrug efflux pump